MPNDANAEQLAAGYRSQGNGIRVHRIYIVVVSVAALVMLIIAVAILGATM